MKTKKVPELGTHITVNHDKGTVSVKTVERGYAFIDAETMKKLKFPKGAYLKHYADGTADITMIVEDEDVENSQ